jgi:hypothetical protein
MISQQKDLSTYQTLLEQTLTQMAEIFEGIPRDAAWTVEDGLYCLAAIQKLRQGWLEGTINQEALQRLNEQSYRLPTPQAVQIRGGLESLQTWLDEIVQDTGAS